MSDDLKNRILQSIQLREIISEHVSLHRSGSHHRGLCPFHEEKTPSFYVYSQHYHCFGCQSHGDAIDFVKNYHGMNFIEALKFLGQKAGIDTTPLERRRGTSKAHKAAVIRQNILASAHHIFTHELWNDSSIRSAMARDYLIQQRSMSAEFLRQHGFGLSFSGSQSLYHILNRQGFSDEALLDASVISPSRSSYQDFFRGRIIFPLENHGGKLIGFAGRVYGEKGFDFPKYKNSRYNKSTVLYGFSRAKKSIRSEKMALVTEGYMDVLRLWNRQFLNAVACQGTALTLPHITSLSQLTPKILLVFDGDSAGESAAFRTLTHALQVPEVEIWRLRLPAGEDPDSFLQKYATEALTELIEKKARPLLEDVILTRLETTPSTAIAGMLQREYLPWIKSLPSDLQKETMLIKISQLTGISHGLLQKELRSISLPRASRPVAKKPAIKRPPAFSEPGAHQRGDANNGGILAQTNTQAAPQPSNNPHPPAYPLPDTPHQGGAAPDNSTPQPPDALASELLCHLFYASPQDQLDPQAIELKIADIFSPETEVRAYLDSMISLLKEGECPANLDDRSAPQLWSEPYGEQLLEQIRAKGARYRTYYRARAIENLFETYRKRNIQRQIDSLKKDLGALSSGHPGPTSLPGQAGHEPPDQDRDQSWKDIVRSIQALHQSLRSPPPSTPGTHRPTSSTSIRSSATPHSP